MHLRGKWSPFASDFSLIFDVSFEWQCVFPALSVVIVFLFIQSATLKKLGLSNEEREKLEQVVTRHPSSKNRTLFE